MNTGLSTVLQDAGLSILATIPFSMELAKLGVAGKRVWGRPSKNNDISEFHRAILAILDDIVQFTPATKQYVKKKEDKVMGSVEDESLIGLESDVLEEIVEDTEDSEV
jgi:hypothetical protein